MRRLVAVLTVIIMILLSITVGIAFKHWELLRDVRDGAEEVGEILGDNGEELGEMFGNNAYISDSAFNANLSD